MFRESQKQKPILENVDADVLDWKTRLREEAAEERMQRLLAKTATLAVKTRVAVAKPKPPPLRVCVSPVDARMAEVEDAGLWEEPPRSPPPPPSKKRAPASRKRPMVLEPETETPPHDFSAYHELDVPAAIQTIVESHAVDDPGLVVVSDAADRAGTAPWSGQDDERDLAAKNPTVFDDTVRFVESGHTYYVRKADGHFFTSAYMKSVSDVYTRAQRPFAEVEGIIIGNTVARNVGGVTQAIAAMRAGITTNTPPDFRDLVHAVGEPAATKIASDAGLLAMVRGERGGYSPHETASRLAQMLPRSLTAKFGGVTRDHVGVWGGAAARGTRVHRALERFYNTGKFTFEENQMEEISRVFPDMLRAYPELDRSLAFRTELSMAFEPLCLTGQLDLLSRSADRPGFFNLYDWKNTKDIRKSVTLMPDFRAAFPNAERTSAGVYGLQLGLYRFMLERHGFKIDDVALFVTHPAHVGPRKISVDHRPREVAWLLGMHRKRVEAMIRNGGRDAPEFAEPPRAEYHPEDDMF